MNNIIRRKWNRNSITNIEDLCGAIFQAEEAGHTFEISGVDSDGNTVALSGTPSGVMLRPDNTDVALDCAVSGGVVTATLPAECYDVQGRFGITIYLTSDEQKTAIYAAVGSVARTSSGNASPETTASVVDLINAIEAAIAEIPASDTNLKGALAPTYSTSAVYPVGSYAWYSGKLYRCTTAITTGETWTSAHWTEAKLGQDVCDLKSALQPLEDSTEKKEIDILPFYPDDDSGTLWLKGYINGSGNYTTNNGVRHRMTSFFLPNTVKSITAQSPYKLNIYIYKLDGTYDHRGMGVSYATNFDFENYKYKFGVVQSPEVSLDGVDWQPSISVNAVPIYWENIDLNTESIQSIIEYGEGSITVENGDFERGSINNSGNNITVNYAYRSISYLSNTIGAIRAKTGCAFGLYIYDSSNAYISRTLDLTEAKLNHDGYKYRVILYHYPLDTTDNVSNTVPGDYINLFTKSINVATEKPKYNVSNGEINVFLEKVQLIIKRVTNTSINVDTWRLYAGYLLNGGAVVGTLWSNSDVEGAIKITGEDDFLGGYHGDEIMSSVVILADGKPVDLETDVFGKQFNEIMICVESDLYHCNTSSLADQIAFKRTKTIKITKEGYTVSNRYIAQSALSIERGALAMISAMKTNNASNPMITYIGCNSDIKLYECPDNSGSDPMPHSQANKPMTSASLYLTGAVLTLSMIYGQNNPSYTPYFNNMTSQNRMKIYFDQYNGQSVASGAVLQDEFSVTFD